MEQNGFVVEHSCSKDGQISETFLPRALVVWLVKTLELKENDKLEYMSRTAVTGPKAP